MPTITARSFDRDKSLNQLGVNYRGSPIVLDERSKDEEGRVYDAYGDSDAVLRAGDRAPDSPGLGIIKEDFASTGQKGKTVTLYDDIFHATHHTILVFSAIDIQAVESLLEKFPKDIFRTVSILPKGVTTGVQAGTSLRVEDSEGYAFKFYLLPEQKSGIVVVRPDGVIGAIVDGVDGVERYLKLVFNI